MTESTELVAADQPQQLITIEPAKYVALVFELFRKKFDAYKAEADEVTIDATTTAGMKTAVEWRAKFRDEIRIASENARKERKAPILEIGRLLDSAAKEIAEEVAPYESRFDSVIKAEEKRKDDEKIARALAESARITAIRTKINEIKDCIVVGMGRSSDELESAISELESTEITLEEYGEFSGEAQAAQVDTVAKLKVMLAAQLALEAEQARLAAEREALERQRAELAEQERQAAAARSQQEARDRAERERAEAEQRAANERAAEAMRRQQAEHETRMRAQQEEIDRQQAEIDRTRAEQERIAREVREAAEARAWAEQKERELAARAEAQRVADEQAAEARRIQAEKDAAEAERIRRERVQFEKNGPGDDAIVARLADAFDVDSHVVVGWLEKFNAATFKAPKEKAA
ncbi:hypothetical protein PQR71_41510 [Paraburkholderia fungorum]|uniref:hypothetical protein n=1 Tax=Paraburkholderia fungorum TaxID=134537 RepID=UPI0038B6DEC1